MHYLQNLFSWTAILICLTIASPIYADTAPDKNSKGKNSKTTLDSKQFSPRKSASKNKNLAKGKESPKRSKHKKSQDDKKLSTSVDDSKIWRKRAKDSKMFSGTASWYGLSAHGSATASGLSYNMYTFTAAHRTLPIGTVVKVTDQDNGRSVMVCITDRGPYIRGRIIDLSYAAANQIHLSSRGIGKVDLEVVSDENGTPLNTNKAWYVNYSAPKGKENVGPFRDFADAAAMHEALRQTHPEAEVVMERAK
ncbi:MAG: septal ring lytic transglycosylase RlpA family protein [Desulfovibrio sp.]|jgi:rare lipoprotein A (peptidoglycan hydrolase)|nr:septal ring lytic transglycosylase RlpA family protein [Desulfovibrio sp.]